MEAVAAAAASVEGGSVHPGILFFKFHPDGASIHWNPAKMAYVPNKMGFAVSYTPWLRALVPDINLAYISGYIFE